MEYRLLRELFTIAKEEKRALYIRFAATALGSFSAPVYEVLSIDESSARVRAHESAGPIGVHTRPYIVGFCAMGIVFDGGPLRDHPYYKRSVPA